MKFGIRLHCEQNCKSWKIRFTICSAVTFVSSVVELSKITKKIRHPSTGTLRIKNCSVAALTQQKINKIM